MEMFNIILTFTVGGEYLKGKRRSGKTTKLFDKMIKSDKYCNLLISPSFEESCIKAKEFSIYASKNIENEVSLLMKNRCNCNDKIYIFMSEYQYNNSCDGMYDNNINIYVDDFERIIFGVLNRSKLFCNLDKVKFLTFNYKGDK